MQAAAQAIVSTNLNRNRAKNINIINNNYIRYNRSKPAPFLHRASFGGATSSGCWMSTLPNIEDNVVTTSIEPELPIPSEEENYANTSGEPSSVNVQCRMVDLQVLGEDNGLVNSPFHTSDSKTFQQPKQQRIRVPLDRSNSLPVFGPTLDCLGGPCRIICLLHSCITRSVE